MTCTREWREDLAFCLKDTAQAIRDVDKLLTRNRSSTTGCATWA